MIVDIGLGQLDNIVDHGLCVDKEKAAAVVLDKVISKDGRAPSVAVSDNTPHLNELLLETRRGKPTAILDQEPRTHNVLQAQCVVAQRCYGHAHEEGTLLRDDVPLNRYE